MPTCAGKFSEAKKSPGSGLRQCLTSTNSKAWEEALKRLRPRNGNPHPARNWQTHDREVAYDGAGAAEVILGRDAPDVPAAGRRRHRLPRGCGQMEAAARAAGNSEMLDQFARDYPQGPHDKPQSMCPAFGSLRVGLRMRRVATVLSGSACCVYGLTFVSPFLRRAAVGGLCAVQLGNAGHRQAVRGHPRRGARTGRPGPL